MERRTDIYMTREENREFLRIVKSVDFLKINPVCKSCNITSSNIYAFTRATSDNDVMVSDKKVDEVTEMIYSCCLFIVDMYNAINKRDDDKKIA